MVRVASFLSMLGLATALTREVRADPSQRIHTSVSPACAGVAQELERRLERRLDETFPAGLEAFVEIDESEAGYRVTIETRAGSKALGTKRIDVASCDEAVDAAVEVLSLAFASQTGKEASGPPPATLDVPPATEPAPPLEPSTNAAATRPARAEARVDRGAAPSDTRSNATSSAMRASLAAGADAGTLAQPTAVVAAGVSRSFSELELRGSVRYGLPVVTETVETGFTESMRSDFGALDLVACYGVGASFRASACAGAEASAVRTTRRLETRDGTDVDEDAVAPRLSGTLGALFSHRGGLIEPEIELAAAAVAVGRDEGASWLALRVTAGAAVEF